MVGAYRALANTLYYLGDFAAARQYAILGVEIWRSGGVQSPPEEVHAPVVTCLCYKAASEWHLGEIASCHATIEEAISRAKELNDTHALVSALWHAGLLGHFEGDPAEVRRRALGVIDLSTRQDFAGWRRAGTILLGWSRSASDDTAEGITRIESGIRDIQERGSR